MHNTASTKSNIINSINYFVFLFFFFRLEVVKNKLNRQNPISIINHEMKVSFNNKKIREKNENFLNSLFPEYSKDEPLENQDQVVEILIELASNEGILSRHYSGYNPHL